MPATNYNGDNKKRAAAPSISSFPRQFRRRAPLFFFQRAPARVRCDPQLFIDIDFIRRRSPRVRATRVGHEYFPRALSAKAPGKAKSQFARDA